jgi:hypothetical protein
MTYDSFHRDADRICCVFRPSEFSSSGVTRHSVNPLAAYLEATFPEVAEAVSVTPPYEGGHVKYEGQEYPSRMASMDSAFFRFFDLRIIEGSMDFLIPDGRKLAITQGMAHKLFGDENPIGKTVSAWDDYTVCAVVEGFPEHSNYAFDLLEAFGSWTKDPSQNWNISSGENTLLRLAPGVDAEAFGKKLGEHKITEGGVNMDGLTLVPITALRYTDSTILREVKFRHILIFALAGLLVILCTLFNCLTLFVNRFRIRQKELALRVVCGASERSLFTLLSVEFVLSLLLALLPGAALVQLLHRPFLQVSEMRTTLSALCGEALLYTGAVMTVALLAFWLLLFLFRRRTLNASIRRSRTNRFRKFSVVVQLLISIGFSFCTIVILKQMHHLHHTDLGFAFRDRGSVVLAADRQGSTDYGMLENRIGQLPEIRETLQAEISLVPLNSRSMMKMEWWDGQPDGAESINMENFRISGPFVSYYELRAVAGEMLDGQDPDSVALINESAVRAFGWDDPVGKHFGYQERNYTVKGVIRDIHNFAPTVPAKPCMYNSPAKKNVNLLLFRFDPGAWGVCRSGIEQIVRQEYPDLLYLRIVSEEEEYDKYLQSENALLQILSFVTLVCLLICVFGFVSLVSLACEERRREMAIRKVSGATVGDILDIFVREYALLLLAGAVVAFPAGYFLMRRWLEQYVTQTGIDAWIYVLILLVLALAVALCVGWRVYRTSTENPADALSSDQ